MPLPRRRDAAPVVLALALALALALVALPLPAAAQGAPLTEQVREWRRAGEHRLLREYLEYLALPNVASDREAILRNAAHIEQMMQRRRLAPRILHLPDSSAPPAVYGEWKVPGATRTLMLYAHYDGQPTDSTKWTGSHPWRPVLRTTRLDRGGEIVPLPAEGEPIDPEWRLYARSASDDKAGVMAILAAVDALKARGLAPTSNLKIFFEGEEEAGSPNLARMLETHRELLEADAWIIADGPVHASGRKQVVFGVRGDVNVDLTVYGPSRPLHSGHYGNWAPNPGMMLARLLASMKDDEGRVLVSGWYDDVEPLGAAEREALSRLPANDAELLRDLGLARAEGRGESLAERIALPSLNVNGIRVAEAGAGARNVIPTVALATLDLRLVRGVDYRRQVERLVEHVRAQGYHVVGRDPTPEERLRHPKIARIDVGPGYNAERTPMDLPISRAVVAAVQSTTANPVVVVPTLGGSLPLATISEGLGTRTITVPIVNPDNNQHAEDENLRLQNLWDGIETMAAILRMP